MISVVSDIFGKMKLINSNTFTGTNPVRSTVTMAVLILCSSVASGESLTTLDGKTYTDIADITKFPQQIHFTCGTDRVVVAITNLPEEFRLRNQITIVTNLIPAKSDTVTATAQTAKALNADDLYLSQHGDSILEVQTNLDVVITNSPGIGDYKLHSCIVRVNAKGFEFNIYSYRCDARGILLPDASNSDASLSVFASFGFKFGEEAVVHQIFDKFIDWEKTARENNVESFTKVLASVPTANRYYATSEKLYRTFEFQWEKDAVIGGSYGHLVINYPPLSEWPSATGLLSKPEAVACNELVKEIPVLKAGLIEKIRSQEAQQTLFK